MDLTLGNQKKKLKNPKTFQLISKPDSKPSTTKKSGTLPTRVHNINALNINVCCIYAGSISYFCVDSPEIYFFCLDSWYLNLSLGFYWNFQNLVDIFYG